MESRTGRSEKNHLTTVSLFRPSRANSFCNKGRNKGTKITSGIDTE